MLQNHDKLYINYNLQIKRKHNSCKNTLNGGYYPIEFIKRAPQLRSKGHFENMQL